LHTVGQFPNAQNMQLGVSQSYTGGHLGVLRISPYEHVVNVAPQQWDNRGYVPTYDEFHLLEGAQDFNVYHLTSHPENHYRPL
ncbi:hypothetical protein MKX03_025447, partial [Papaver bracteatum]